MRNRYFIIILLLVASLIIFVLSQNKIANAQDGLSEQASMGKTIFDEVNCLLCHLLNGEGGGLEDAPDFAGVSTRKTDAEFTEWLSAHLFEEPRILMFEEPPTDEDIANLKAYLLTL